GFRAHALGAVGCDRREPAGRVGGLRPAGRDAHALLRGGHAAALVQRRGPPRPRRPLARGDGKSGPDRRGKGRAAERAPDAHARHLRRAGGMGARTVVLRARPAGPDRAAAERSGLDRGMSARLDFFYSFRSPYSYLAAPRAFELPDRFEVNLAFRGVIPMA